MTWLVNLPYGHNFCKDNIIVYKCQTACRKTFKQVIYKLINIVINIVINILINIVINIAVDNRSLLHIPLHLCYIT